jgi:hypothetical protein
LIKKNSYPSGEGLLKYMMIKVEDNLDHESRLGYCRFTPVRI